MLLHHRPTQHFPCHSSEFCLVWFCFLLSWKVLRTGCGQKHEPKSLWIFAWGLWHPAKCVCLISTMLLTLICFGYFSQPLYGENSTENQNLKPFPGVLMQEACTYKSVIPLQAFPDDQCRDYQQIRKIKCKHCYSAKRWYKSACAKLCQNQPEKSKSDMVWQFACSQSREYGSDGRMRMQ